MMTHNAATLFLLLVARAVTVGAQPQGIEIEFAPMGPMMDGPPPELLDLLQGDQGAFGRSGGTPSSQDSKEARLDNELNNMLGSLMGAPSGQGRLGGSGFTRQQHQQNRRNIPGGGPFGPSGAFGGSSEVVVEDGGDGPTMVMELDGPPSGAFGQRSAFPADMFRELFPGPIGGGVQEDHPHPFEDPDPLVQNLVKDLDQSFLGLMNGLQKAASSDRTPNSCADDIQKNCIGAKSSLHCLGQHADVISESCHKDIGKSVPFRCSSSIDRFCDVLQVGILQCLGDHLADLPGECRDAVLATHHVITKANTHQAALVDTSTGTRQVSRPSAAAPVLPPLQSAALSSSAPFDVPKGVTDLLGVAPSKSAVQASQTWSSSRLYWLGGLVFVVGILFYAAPDASLPTKQLSSLWRSVEKKESESLLRGASPGMSSSGRELRMPGEMEPLQVLVGGSV